MSTTSPKTILVIEDDKSLSRIILLKLKAAGYRVLFAENAEDAFGLLAEEIPDLIWLDVYLPGMNGFEFLEHLRKNPRTKDIRVAVVSVSGSNKKVELAEKFGVTDYFVKSNYRIEELVQLVTGILNRSDK
ncbi:MAG: response regulator [Patescibacteria group bacterium]|nr:response regulator [Patescibacteria group bacterium]